MNYLRVDGKFPLETLRALIKHLKEGHEKPPMTKAPYEGSHYVMLEDVTRAAVAQQLQLLRVDHEVVPCLPGGKHLRVTPQEPSQESPQNTSGCKHQKLADALLSDPEVYAAVKAETLAVLANPQTFRPFTLFYN